MASERERIDAYSIAVEAERCGTWQSISAHAEEILGLVRSTVRIDLKPQIDDRGVAAALVADLARSESMHQQRAEGYEDGYEACKAQMLEVLDKLLALKPKDRKGSECFLREMTKTGASNKNLGLFRDYIVSFHDSHMPDTLRT